MAVAMARGRSVLVVDEDAASRLVLRQAYKLRGHRCSIVATASEALVVVGIEPPEVVILEWSFRDGSGVGLAARLRQACPRPLVIVVLSVLDEPDGFRAREAIDDYVVKPAPADVVERAIDACFARRQS